MFDEFIQAASESFNVPEAMIRSVIDVESNWDPHAFRLEPRIHDASYGLMQLLESTARGLGFEGDVSGLFDPETNIRYGTKLLAQLRDRYGDDRSVFSAYNSGRPDLWQTSSQVAGYVEKAMSALSRYVATITETAAEHPEADVALLAAVVIVWFLFTRKRG